MRSRALVAAAIVSVAGLDSGLQRGRHGRAGVQPVGLARCSK